MEVEPVVRGMVRHALTGFGYNILETHSGRHTLQVCGEHSHKVLLLLIDKGMPEGIFGFDLADRQLTSNNRLGVIYTGGCSLALSSAGFNRQNSLNFLQKPYRLQTLMKTLRNRLDN